MLRYKEQCETETAIHYTTNSITEYFPAIFVVNTFASHTHRCYADMKYVIVFQLFLQFIVFVLKINWCYNTMTMSIQKGFGQRQRVLQFVSKNVIFIMGKNLSGITSLVDGIWTKVELHDRNWLLKYSMITINFNNSFNNGKLNFYWNFTLRNKHFTPHLTDKKYLTLKGNYSEWSRKEIKIIYGNKGMISIQ